MVVLISLLGITLLSCDEILEKDITQESVLLLAPADSLTTEEVSITFYWEYLQGTHEYLLRVGTPDLQDADFIMLDTLVAKNRFQLELPPGQYQWCVKGMNAGYETKFSCRTLWIVE